MEHCKESQVSVSCSSSPGTKQVVSVLLVPCSNLLDRGTWKQHNTLYGPAEILVLLSQRTELIGHNSVSSYYFFFLMGQLHRSQANQNCDAVVEALA